MHLKKKGIPWDLKINARKFEIGTLPLGVPVSGRAGLDIRVKGSLDEPKVSGRGRIGRPCYTTPYGKRPLCFRRLDVAGEWLGDRFSLEQLRVRDNRRTLLDITGTGQQQQQAENRSFTNSPRITSSISPFAGSFAI